MISIKPSSVPEYLKGSAFFANLSEDDQEVSVPKDCYKLDTSVTNAAELDELLRTLRFWGVDRTPTPVFRFTISNNRVIWDSVAATYVADLPMVAQLVRVLDYKREKQVCEAASLRNMDLVSCLIEHGYPENYEADEGVYSDDSTDAVEIAARNGDLDILKVLNLNRFQCNQNVVISAAMGGHYACVEYLMQNGCPVAEDLINYAFASGSLDCLRFLHETLGCPWTDGLFSKLSSPWIYCSLQDEEKLLQCLEYAQANGCPRDRNACYTCAILGFPLLLQHLHESSWPWSEDVVKVAAGWGDVNCLKYAMEHGCPVPKELMWDGMLSGNVDIIHYLHDSGVPWPERPLFLLSNEHIPNMGNVSVSLAYAYSLGCPRDPNTCYYASMYGWLDILKDGYQHGCAVDVVCTREAAGHGHLECLKYLHEIGCPWDEDAAAGALISEHYDCLRYLIQHGCPVSQITMRKYNAFLQSAK